MSMPTQEIYADLQRAYDHFNRDLFDSELPPCVITLQREKDTPGYYSRNRWGNTEGVKHHEISMNPSFFVQLPIEVVLSNMVHDMTHMYQDLKGAPGRNRYHNTEWGDLLEHKAGLMPSSTGLPGGRRKGDQMKHYIIDGGRFDQSCKSLIDDEYALRWLDLFPNKIEHPPEIPSAMTGMDLAGEGELQTDNDGHGRQVAEASPPPELNSRIVLEPDSDHESQSLPGTRDEPPSNSPPPKKKNSGPPPPPMKVFLRPDDDALERLGVAPPKDRKAGVPNRYKFTCPSCGLNAWGKIKAVLCCGICPDKPLMPGVPA